MKVDYIHFELKALSTILITYEINAKQRRASAAESATRIRRTRLTVTTLPTRGRCRACLPPVLLAPYNDSDVNFGFPVTPAAWGSVWLFLPPVWSGSVENRRIGILTVSRTTKSRSRSSIIVDHLLILYMYDHSSATRTKRIEVSLFFSQGISGQSCAKNSPFVSKTINTGECLQP
ncbi:hypothetical protein BGY98DRAFT_352175 [Russula aff. rugulosa BPL654]|nr:hypothetical protein BGY98DRAFT_352175 [Russula aff. rugulosa BPL654]